MKKIIIVVSVIIISLQLFLLKTIGETNPSEIIDLPYPITTLFAENKKIFIGTSSGLYVSLDGGKNFLAKNKGLSDLEITGITKVGEIIFIGTKEGGLYSGNYDAEKWDSLASKVDCPTVTSISSEKNTIYVTSVCSGFHLSLDGGLTWVERNGGLPTLKTTSFIKTPSGRFFLGTDHFGLFYSDNLSESCNWVNIFKDYTITSLSYFGSNIFSGTNAGLFVGDVKSGNFKSLNIIGGNPYVGTLLYFSNRLFVALSDFGAFATIDGVNFTQIFKDLIISPTAIFLENATKSLSIGDSTGKVYSVDLSKPFLLSKDEVDLGAFQKGIKISGTITVRNLGLTSLSGTATASSFVKFKSTTFTDQSEPQFEIDTSTLNPDSYSIPVKLSSNGGDKTVYINFKLMPQGGVTVKLKIGSLTAYVNGEAINLDAAPFIDKLSGRTLVPVRFISQALGANIEWNSNEKKVTIKKEATETSSPKLIEIWIGKMTARVNLQETTMDVSPQIIPPGRTMVPLRFIGEALDGTVNWNPTTKEITITVKN